jgi:hypothetical protein
MSNDSSGNPDELSSGGSRYHQVYDVCRALPDSWLHALTRFAN